jgi:adenylate cyclase
MPRRDPALSPADQAADLSADDLALRLGVGRDRVEQLADVGAIESDADGRFDPGDVHRVRLLLAFEEAGVPIEALLEASRVGAISLRYYDQLHPPPGPLSGRSYGELRASAGRGSEHLSQLFAAFGLAEPEPDSRLTLEDEQLVTDMLATVIETAQPDLALRAIRMFGEGARRAADGALGVYREAVDRAGDDLQGLPEEALFRRLLQPWARFARQSPRLSLWLASQHLSRAIDEYSVTESERILEDAGFVATRDELQPSVAFIDLTGFTRLTEERGDEVAAATAMRLGELTTDTIRPQGGRIVKLLGDGVLVRFDDPAAAAAGTLDLLAALPGAGLPSAHAGLASGPLIVRDGDVFGRTVNLAARIADAAPDGHLYMPEDVAATLGLDRFTFQPTGDVQLQGIGRVALVHVARATN